MTFTPHGKHLIAGEWLATDTTFQSEPAHGAAHAFSMGTPEVVNAACAAAEEAFWDYGYSSREARPAFLHGVCSGWGQNDTLRLGVIGFSTCIRP